MNIMDTIITLDTSEESRPSNIISRNPRDDSNIAHLSRLYITGKLDINTPFCVLKEVAIVHKVDIPEFKDNENSLRLENFINELNESGENQPVVSIPIASKTEWLDVANFINSEVIWSEAELHSAFQTIRIFMKNYISHPSENFIYGQITPGNTNCLNACCLYKICTYYNLPLTFNHNLDQLAQAVRMIIQNKRKSCLYLSRQISTFYEEGLAHLYLVACELEQETTLSSDNVTNNEDIEMVDYYQDIQQSIITFTDHTETRKRIIPRTHGEAIVLSALIYRIDISSSDNPIAEYNNLCENSNYWTPLNADMRRALNINPSAFQLRNYFNPLLPYELYDENEIYHLALDEGYTKDELNRESAYSLLENSYLLPTFHHGLYPTIINESTFISLEPLIELDPNSIICYGVRVNSLIAFTYRELAQLIKNQLNFSNPVEDNQAFSRLGIKKLKILCKLIVNGDTEQVMEDKNTLLESIQLAELFTEESNGKARELYEFFHNSEKEIQNDILNALYSLFYLSMYSRGWLGTGQYPLENAPVYNQTTVDINVTKAIVEFETLCNKFTNENEENLILDLPLLKYRNEWQTSTRDSDGLTIGERFEMLKQGENIDNIYGSCMRETSNWLAYSSHRYLTVLGEKEPFELDLLHWIS